MCEENTTPVSLAKLVTAFAKAKLEMGRLIATETAQVKSEKANYSYRYADLAGVLDVIDKPLASNGLVFVQSPVVDYSQSGARVTVHGTLYHESGEFLLAAPLVMMSQQTDPQKVGSAITYGRRYQAVAFFGLAQEDDDGKSAGDKPKQPSQAQQQRQAAPTPQPAQHRQQPAQVNGATKPVAPSPVIAQAEIVASDSITLDNVPEASDGHGTDGKYIETMPDGKKFVNRWQQDIDRAVNNVEIQRIARELESPPAAQTWAIKAGYCKNEFEARNSFAKIVKSQFDGKLTPDNMASVIHAYVAHQLDKAPAEVAA